MHAKSMTKNETLSRIMYKTELAAVILSEAMRDSVPKYEMTNEDDQSSRHPSAATTPTVRPTRCSKARKTRLRKIRKSSNRRRADNLHTLAIACPLY